MGVVAQLALPANRNFNSMLTDITITMGFSAGATLWGFAPFFVFRMTAVRAFHLSKTGSSSHDSSPNTSKTMPIETGAATHTMNFTVFQTISRFSGV
jgi:hypothetical protein